MQGTKVIFYILASFITGVLLLIFTQYNSSKNINSLIQGNEKLLEEFNMANELRDLEKNVVLVESKIRGMITTSNAVHIDGLEAHINQVETALGRLQKITDYDSSVELIDILDTLVRQKLLFSRQIMAVYQSQGKAGAEQLIATNKGKKLTDSIDLVARKIDSTRKKLLTGITASIDQSGKKAKRFGEVLIIAVLVAAAMLFWYIINTIRKQARLIERLNISEKKEREAAAIKDNFLANMSHEIRTPMNAMLGFTNLLRRKKLDDESEEYLRVIQKSGENLLTIINDILDLSKIEAGMIRIESAPFSIRGLVQSIEVMFKAKAAEKQLALSVLVDREVPDILEGDATRLTQILVNLIGNALKFTGKGKVEVSITGKGITDGVLNACITVSDTGIGVEKDKLSHIFDRFRQAEDSVTRNYGGTGLGLSIVKELVLLQNGTIEVDSEVNKGTVFTLMIPYKVSSEANLQHPVSESWLIKDGDFENHFILVVEDNEINQSLIKHLFKNWQLKYDLANNGREAIDLLHKKKYDLILMDIQMPEMDGYAAAQEIRNTLKLQTPIIAMTAHALAGEKEKCLSYGMNEYISKPIREEQLHRLIARFTLLDTRLARQELSTALVPDGAYKYIDLTYMKAVSGGNKEYEKTVTAQFVELIPHDLLQIEKAWQEKQISDMQQLAHNMKTTVSVMGLNEVLQPQLDILEYEELDEMTFSKQYLYVKTICEAAVEEARRFYATF